MKWRYYNLMTKEDKEEYDYKFEDNGIASSLFSTMYFSILFMGLCMFFIMIVSLVLYIPEMSIYEPQIVTWMNTVSNMMQVWMLIIVVTSIIDIVSSITHMLDESKWLKKKGYILKFAELDFERRKERINK